MKSLQLALLPGAIAGVLAIIASWLIMGVIFHRFQRETPETWRAENKSSYLFAMVIRFLACLAMATLFLFVGRNYGSPFSDGMERALAFGVVAWTAIAAPILVESAIFIRLHPMVVFAQLLDWLVTSLLVTGIAGWMRNT